MMGNIAWLPLLIGTFLIATKVRAFPDNCKVVNGIDRGTRTFRQFPDIAIGAIFEYEPEDPNLCLLPVSIQYYQHPNTTFLSVYFYDPAKTKLPENCSVYTSDINLPNSYQVSLFGRTVNLVSVPRSDTSGITADAFSIFPRPIVTSQYGERPGCLMEFMNSSLYAEIPPDVLVVSPSPTSSDIRNGRSITTYNQFRSNNTVLIDAVNVKRVRNYTREYSEMIMPSEVRFRCTYNVFIKRDTFVVYLAGGPSGDELNYKGIEYKVVCVDDSEQGLNRLIISVNPPKEPFTVYVQQIEQANVRRTEAFPVIRLDAEIVDACSPLEAFENATLQYDPPVRDDDGDYPIRTTVTLRCKHDNIEKQSTCSVNSVWVPQIDARECMSDPPRGSSNTVIIVVVVLVLGVIVCCCTVFIVLGITTCLSGRLNSTDSTSGTSQKSILGPGTPDSPGSDNRILGSGGPQDTKPTTPSQGTTPTTPPPTTPTKPPTKPALGPVSETALLTNNLSPMGPETPLGGNRTLGSVNAFAGTPMSPVTSGDESGDETPGQGTLGQGVVLDPIPEVEEAVTV